jgi:hypothetical protein
MNYWWDTHAHQQSNKISLCFGPDAPASMRRRSVPWGHVEELQGNVVGILGVQMQAVFILDDP